MVRADWVRAKDGVISGVCASVARTFDIEPWLVRFVWMFAVFFAGAGVFLYALLTIALPREDNVAHAFEPKLMGVCVRIAERADMDIGLTRFLALLLLFASLGWAILAYVVLYFALPSQPAKS